MHELHAAVERSVDHVGIHPQALSESHMLQAAQFTREKIGKNELRITATGYMQITPKPHYVNTNQDKAYSRMPQVKFPTIHTRDAYPYGFSGSVVAPPMTTTRKDGLLIARTPVIWSSFSASITVVLLPEGCESLLLGVCVDVCTDDEGNDVKEWYPSLLRQELLGKCESNGRGGPRNLHDREETCTNGSANLVEGAGAGDDCH